ncbi:phage tail protein [Hyalangium minutum]|uniref:Microcystin dependent protein n=1 Tax=Hyalangium minutum TaxID=394096 RepID=A0A085WKN8_9BACT|nr:tail fiber protein [Hyalangium minutum]KFE68251.1 Microcystin dependent protein [Hyalangium minutum]
MSEPFLGEIRMFSGNFAPSGWALCDGQLLSIAQNSALFSILGTTFGGNGQTTFALPDLRGRVPMGWGQGPGLSPRTIGEQSGSETVTLIATQMPAHTHAMMANSGQGTQFTPEGAVSAAAVESTQQPLNLYSTTPNTTMSPQAIGIAGGSQPHQNMQPFLCISFIIALQGIYPSRG